MELSNLCTLILSLAVTSLAQTPIEEPIPHLRINTDSCAPLHENLLIAISEASELCLAAIQSLRDPSSDLFLHFLSTTAQRPLVLSIFQRIHASLTSHSPSTSLAPAPPPLYPTLTIQCRSKRSCARPSLLGYHDQRQQPPSIVICLPRSQWQAHYVYPFNGDGGGWCGIPSRPGDAEWIEASRLPSTLLHELLHVTALVGFETLDWESRLDAVYRLAEGHSLYAWGERNALTNTPSYEFFAMEAWREREWRRLGEWEKRLCRTGKMLRIWNRKRD